MCATVRQSVGWKWFDDDTLKARERNSCLFTIRSYDNGRCLWLLLWCAAVPCDSCSGVLLQGR